MINLTQTPKQIAIDLINDANGTDYAFDDVVLGTPATNTTTINGLNTTITIAEKNGSQRLKVDLQYNRLDFTTLLARPYCQLPEKNVSRLVDLIPFINEKYNLALTAVDIVDGPYRPTELVEGVKKIAVTVAANHLVYIGEVMIYIGEIDAVERYFNRLQFQVSSDYTSLKFTGGVFDLGFRKVVDVDKLLVQKSGIKALYLTEEGLLQPSANYVDGDVKLAARFKNNRLCEVLGLNGETSYDNTGKLLPKIPVIPTPIAAIPETLGITASLNNDVLTYNMTFDVASKRAATGLVYYVDNVSGNDTNEGNSEIAAFKTFRRALNALPAARVIRVKGNDGVFYDADSGWTQTVINRKLDVIGFGDTAPVFTATKVSTDWKAQVTNIWYLDLPNVASVVDSTVKTDGGYGRMVAKTSLADVTSTPHSFFIDNTINRVYVHLTDNRKPSTDVYLVTKVISGAVGDKSEIFIENCHFDLGYTGFSADMTLPRTFGYLYLNQCTFGWTFKDSSFQSFGYNVISQDCVAKYGFAGGFKYNTDRVVPSMGTKYWVIEKNATVAFCGFDGNDTSNGSRIGANGTILRFNGKYQHCDGDQVMDTGDNTFSLNIACQSSNVNNSLNNLSHYSVGLNATKQTEAHYWSCKLDTTGFSYSPKGEGKIFLFDTDIGQKPTINKVSPYQFLYTA